MPEGDTVFRTARRLHEALAGREVTRFEVRVPRAASADLSGEVVQEVTARGKHLLIRLGAWTLHSRLKMEGEWRIYGVGEPWRVPSFKARAIVQNARHQAVGFDLAMVDVVPARDESRVVGHLGPDPLGPDWDLTEAVERLGADPRPIHVALLDQRNVAGFGNEYANELLFVRGILPSRPATELDVPPLLATGARMIQANRERRVRTFTGDTRSGRTTWVYGRAGRPCRRCGTPVESGALGGDPTRERDVFWCPRCQR